MALPWAVLNVSAEYGFYSAYRLPKYVTIRFVQKKALTRGLILPICGDCANHCTFGVNLAFSILVTHTLTRGTNVCGFKTVGREQAVHKLAESLKRFQISEPSPFCGILVSEKKGAGEIEDENSRRVC